MDKLHPADKSFIDSLKAIVTDHLSQEGFGVEQLAEAANLNRTSLYRKVKALTGKNVSQFISEIRLQKALELLQQERITAAEVAYKVGFSSPSYFNKCFHDYHGYPPGEARKKVLVHEEEVRIKGKWQQWELLRKVLVIVAIPGLFLFAYLLSNSLKERKRANSIVVLPFKNLGTDMETEYFADAIMDGILTQLSSIEDLSVRSRTTSDYIGTNNMPLKSISKEVKARYILEGSVQKTGDRVRITVQFIDGKKDTHIWSQNYDRVYANILEIQSEVALKVADKLHIALSDDESNRIKSYAAQNPEAWDNYLRGRFLLNKANAEQRIDISPENLKKSLTYFEKAIALDSTFALAYAGLANTYMNLATWNWLPNRKEGVIMSWAYSTRALDLNPDCAEALAVQAVIHIWGSVESDYEKGREKLKRALELKPDYPPALQYYAQLLMIIGPIEEARLHMDRAMNQEPYFWLMHNLNAWIYYFEEKHWEAIEACQNAKELNPDFIVTDWLFFLNYVKLGKGEEAMAHLQKIIETDEKTKSHAEELPAHYRATGISGLFNYLIQLNNENPGYIQGLNGQPYYNAWWHALLGEKEESIRYLQRALLKGDYSYTYFRLIAMNPDFDFLRGDPRFQEVIDGMGLTKYDTRPRTKK